MHPTEHGNRIYFFAEDWNGHIIIHISCDGDLYPNRKKIIKELSKFGAEDVSSDICEISVIFLNTSENFIVLLSKVAIAIAKHSIFDQKFFVYITELVEMHIIGLKTIKEVIFSEYEFQKEINKSFRSLDSKRGRNEKEKD